MAQPEQGAEAKGSDESMTRIEVVRQGARVPCIVNFRGKPRFSEVGAPKALLAQSPAGGGDADLGGLSKAPPTVRSTFGAADGEINIWRRRR
jgi:hypothetical protein